MPPRAIFITCDFSHYFFIIISCSLTKEQKLFGISAVFIEIWYILSYFMGFVCWSLLHLLFYTITQGVF